jgi:hypothetical protein
MRIVVRYRRSNDLMPYSDICGFEVWRGGLGGTYRLPTLSSLGTYQLRVIDAFEVRA